jgi:hypothetical protein
MIAIAAPRVEKTAWTLSEYWLAFVLAGYMTMGRSFAHLGVWPVFVGEATLAGFYFWRRRDTLGLFVAALMRPRLESLFAWGCFLSIGYGVMETARGLLGGHSPSITLQCLVFHVYPLYLWIGMAVGSKRRDFLRRILPPIAWANAAYGMAYLLAFAPLGLTDDLDMHRTGMFGQPCWSGTIVVALLALYPRLGSHAVPLVLNTIVLLAMQSRTEWITVAIAVPLWGVLSGRLAHVAMVAAALAGLLAIGWVADVRVPSPASRHGGELSVRSLAAQSVAAIDPSAERWSRDIEARAGTLEWRTSWWREIVKMVHQRPLRAAFGPGYGYPIWDLHPWGTDDFPLRTPHNVFVYALGYTGWVGVAVFVLVMGGLLAALVTTWRTTGQCFGICLWVMGCLRSQADNYFESPHFAIVFFTLAGLAISLPGRTAHPAREAQSSEAQSSEAPP